ncbi:queuosine precursor transporter [Legionella fairfieldensis]|uniref:queuosine precursor transporter n=1 Tax=Legionella fairfieldensis TaxID=45064 RepID=UPI00048D1955|nr:queuosine precursor transporter [Legionella fairfieldensis]
MHLNTSNIKWLVVLHVLILCVSNTLVQYPFIFLGVHTTWGAFSYPLIFILTDLSTRLSGAKTARTIIFMAMIPGFIFSYFISNYYAQVSLFAGNILVLRIALASFLAYVIGQLLDILVFQKLRYWKKWWIAPSLATVFGNLVDTYCFFFIAFFHSSNTILNEHWLEMATADLAFKLLIGLLSFIPLYGFILQLILRHRFKALS